MADASSTADLVTIVCDLILKTISNGLSRIEFCALHRVSCEGWLKVELLQSLSLAIAVSNNEDANVRSELDNVDLTIWTPSQRVLLELKTFPTNYGRGGKPITDFIGKVVKDLEKLSTKRGEATGLATWLAYPIPRPEPHYWSGHLRKVEKAASEISRSERLDLPIVGDQAYLYIMKSK